MTRRIELTPDARQDLFDAARWYEKRKPRLGARLVLEVDRVLVKISERPGSFPVVYRDMRRASTDVFQYGIFFQERDQTIYVVAIVDMRRRPGTWRRRAMK